MKKKDRKITRRTFLKSGLVAGGVGAGLSLFSLPKLYAQPKPVKIGLVAPLTGGNAHWGTDMYECFKLAAAICNEDGGIKSMGGAKVELVVADFESKPEVAAIQAEKLIENNEILMLSGSMHSAAGMLVSQIAERNRICYITPTDKVPQITQRGLQYTYRTCSTTFTQVKSLVEFVRDVGQKTGKVPKKVAILCENSITGVTAGDEFLKQMKEGGFEIVDYSTYDAVTTKDFTGYISKYKSIGADLLVGSNRNQDTVLIARTMKELNFNPYNWCSAEGGVSSIDMWRLLGKDVNYFIASAGFADVTRNIPHQEKIVPLFKKALNVTVADTSLVTGFGVVALLKAALEKNPTYDRESFKRAVDQVEVKAGEYYNMQIDGIKWDSKHDNAWARAFIVQWENGRCHCVAPTKYAVREPVWPRPTWDKI
jgi:branched-chain amino acid transport system substrate-binding protein